MARHRPSKSEPLHKPVLDISSLIDCTFLLLIYFLVTTTIQKREQDLDLSLPTPFRGIATDLIEPLFIHVDQQGTVSVGTGAARQIMDTDTSVRDLPMLSQHLEMFSQAANAAGIKPLVQIHVEGEAQQQRVVDVLNTLAGADIHQVTFTDLVDPS